VGLSAALKNIGAVYAKTAESIEMPFERLTWMDQGNHVSVGVPILVGKGQFFRVVRPIQKHWKSLFITQPASVDIF